MRPRWQAICRSVEPDRPRFDVRTRRAGPTMASAAGSWHASSRNPAECCASRPTIAWTGASYAEFCAVPELDIVRIQEMHLADGEDATVLHWAAETHRIVITQD